MDRYQAAVDGLGELLDSKTWHPDPDDVEFAVGYVCSYVRQVTRVQVTPMEREAIRRYIRDAITPQPRHIVARCGYIVDNYTNESCGNPLPCARHR